MLEAACLAKLATWACTAAAAALKAHDLDMAAVLADLSGRTIEAGHALHDRPRDVVRKAADRLAARIEREHRDWLQHAFGSDIAGRQDAEAVFAALDDVLSKCLPSAAQVAQADLDPHKIADLVVANAGADAQFRAGSFGGRILHALVLGAYQTALDDPAFAKALDLSISQVLLERSHTTVDATSRIDATTQRIEGRLPPRPQLIPLHKRKAPPGNLRELLMTELRATTLVGRQEELAPLKAWLGPRRRGRRDIAVHCVTGPAGAGKTRLAIELCEWADGQGWSAGFLRQQDLADHPSDWRWDRPTLAVVDYAASSLQALRRALDELASGNVAPNEPPLRILLLERHASRDAGWWLDLTQSVSLTGDGRDALIDPSAPLALGPLRDLEHRRALLAQAMHLAGPLLDKPPPVPPSPVPQAGADAWFDDRLADDAIETEPLFLAMAGIVAAETGAPTALSMSRLDLAFWLADRERQRLARRARDGGADADLVPYLAVCVTLQGGCDADAAAALAEEERAAFGDRSATRTGELLAMLGDALAPAEGEGIDAVRPDLIGEAFLLRELGREQRSVARQAAIVERAFGRAGQRVVATLIRTAQDYARDDAAHPSVSWLDHLARLTDDPFALMAIANELPEQTLALRERAAEIHQRIAKALATRAVDDVNLLPLLAMARNNLANRLSALGEREAALDAAREAVEIRRALAASRPDAFRPNLATSLNNLAAMLSALGAREAALTAAREAAELYRALAASRPDAFRPNLAMSLNNLAAMLSALGEREAALAAAREAVELYRALAASRPDAFRPDLAGSLNNLANRLSALGEREAALDAAREAAELYRALAASRPDAFRPDLAMSLNNLANRLSELGEREAALAAAREAVELYRALAASRPDAFRPNLATSLNNLAATLSALGEPEAALDAAREAAGLYRALAASRPDAFRPNLAMSLNNLAATLSALGEPEAALDAAREAAGLYRALAASRPDAFRPNLATSLWVLADCLDALEQREAGVAANAEAIATLAAPFQRHPAVFADRITAMARDYLQRCEALGRQPDVELLAPVAAGLAALQAAPKAAG